MKDGKKLKFLYDITAMAIENGLDISVELQDNGSYSKTMNGVLTNSEYKNNGIILRAYNPEKENSIDETENDDE